jgi:uncharacterized protein involved in exopolysaccharide biosynthesis
MSEPGELTPPRPRSSVTPGRALPGQAAPAGSGLFLPEEPGCDSAAAPGFTARGLTLRNYLHLWRRYRRMMTAIMLATLVGSAVRLLVLSPDIYMAKVTILPSGGQGQSSVMGLLAGFAGAPPVGIGGGDESSSALFPRILESRTLGIEVLRAQYAFDAGGERVNTTLYAYLAAENDDQALLALAGLRAIDIDKETGMLTLSVRTGNPQLSAQICERYVEALEKFNDETRLVTAKQHGEFIRERLNQTLAELAAAEERLADFKARNMRMNDPGLELERLRLERDVVLKSQVFTTLTSQAEVSRIEEAKNIPVVRILDRPNVPAMPVPVPLVAGMAAGLIVGVILALTSVAGVEFWRYLRAEMQHV